MHVQLFNIYFGGDTIGTGRVAADIADALASAGHSVHVITTTADYGALDPGHLHSEECADRRIRVSRLAVPLCRRSPLVRRLLIYGIFTALSAPAAVAARRADVAVLVLPPSLACLPGAIVSLIRRTPLIIDAEDLYSTNPVRLSVLSRVNEWIERWLIRHATVVRVLSESTATKARALGDAKVRIACVPVWADTIGIDPSASGSGFRARHGLEGRFVALHSGNVGSLGGQIGIIDAAEILATEPDIQFVFIGGGYGIQRVRDSASARGLRNILFLDRVPRSELSGTLTGADVGLVTLDARIGIGSVPSKLFGYLAAGLPVVASLDPTNPASAAVSDSGCGWVVPQGSGSAIARAIMDARDIGCIARRAMGTRGLQWVRERHAHGACLRAMVHLIESVGLR